MATAAQIILGNLEAAESLAPRHPKERLRVFRCPSGKRKYLDLYSRIQEAGWQVLSVKKSSLYECWLIRCAEKQWFLNLRHEQQVRVAKGERP